MKSLYLLLTVVGAIVPLVLFAEFFAAAGYAPGVFIAATFANPAASAFVADLLISSVVFWVWMSRRAGPSAWPFMLLNCCIGLSCALPAYLYACEVRRSKRRVANLVGARA